MCSAAAKVELSRAVQHVMSDFVQEVEITCDLKHRNLVQLLGALPIQLPCVCAILVS